MGMTYNSSPKHDADSHYSAMYRGRGLLEWRLRVANTPSNPRKTGLAWTRRAQVDASAVLPVRVGLAQRNLDMAHDLLMEVSSPTSPKFAQHWTADDVAKMFSPGPDAVTAVREWLTSAGISPKRVSISHSRGWLAFNATVRDIETLLRTSYNLYEHEETGTLHIACESYSGPEPIRQHVDFITPTIHFDKHLISPRSSRRTKRETKALAGGNPGSGITQKDAGLVDMTSISEAHDLSYCNESITLDCLRALYQIPFSNHSSAGNSFGIVEYSPLTYLQSDLDIFFARFAPHLVGTSPTVDLIDGANRSAVFPGPSSKLEGDLDVQYSVPFVYPLNVAVYQVGDVVNGASYGQFLDAIDGSYCTYDSGDEPPVDPVYPDPSPGGYNGTVNCGGFSATNVISTSYEMDEWQASPSYERRQCYEYLKLGLLGVTMLFASGDFGVSGNMDSCYSPFLIEDVFNPTFPSTCPYVTSVGATQIMANGTVNDPEGACETEIFSAGGFSNVFPLPSYQSSAVGSYWENYPSPYSAVQFNNSQQTRGFPGVAANGANYVVAVDGQFQLVWGTSASAPVWGSIITLINDARIEIGKNPVGFINPTLYAHPEVMNDITQGSNPGCETNGFDAVPGWDPVTGLGTPNFPKMLELFMSLP